MAWPEAPPAGNDIHGELLDKLGFDRGGDTVIPLLSGALVQQGRNIALSQLPGNPGGMSRRVLEQAGHLRAAQQIVLQQRQENRLGLQWILMGNPQLERTVTDLQNQFARARGDLKGELLRSGRAATGRSPCVCDLPGPVVPARPIRVSREKSVPRGIARCWEISWRRAPSRNRAKARILLTTASPSVPQAFSILLSE